MTADQALDRVRFDERGLVPVVVRDTRSGRVSMLAWADRPAIERTLSSGEATFWSRSRGAPWVKGETSGHRMTVSSVVLDCDADAVLYEASLAGPACHTGEASCFHDSLLGGPSGSGASFDLAPLFEILGRRYRERPAESYSTRLFEKGLDHALKKVGEEASEVIVAMKNPDDGELAGEIADLLYHLAVAMTIRRISPERVNEVLARRRLGER